MGAPAKRLGAPTTSLGTTVTILGATARSLGAPGSSVGQSQKKTIFFGNSAGVLGNYTYYLIFNDF
jgi:hypothetical protein